MPTTINDFFSQAYNKQFARDFFMRVQLIQIAGMVLVGDEDLVFAKTASLPGRNIQNKIVNYSGQQFNLNGKSEYPNSESYSIEFYHTQDLDLRKKLELASRAAFDNEITGGQMCMPGAEAVIILDLLGADCGPNRQGGQPFKKLDEIKFIGCSIRNIGEVAYQIADGTGEVLSIPCTFSYHWYENFAK